MGAEIASGRLMAPFFGTSLLIWTTIIGSTMMALTAGYYLGGIVSEKKPNLDWPAKALFCASAYLIFLPYFSKPVMAVSLSRFANIGSDSSNAVVLALIICGILVSAPLIILGMTSPYVIKLYGSSETGKASGRVFAVSTLGSILGTFLPVLVLIPLVGVKLTFLFFGGILLISVLPGIKNSRNYFIISALIIITVALGLGFNDQENPNLLAKKETQYEQVSIYRAANTTKDSSKANNTVFMITDAGLGLQSMWTDGLTFTNSWQDFFAVIPKIFEVQNGRKPEKILIIGLGGAVAPYVISNFYPDAEFDGVEIDAGMIETAKPFFPYSKIKNLNTHISDGRLFLESSTRKYDVIIVDSFRPPHIPVHMATAEFFKSVMNHLDSRGILGMNIGTRGKMQVFNAIANTASVAIPFVYFAQYYSPEGESIFTSRFLIGSREDLNLLQPEIENQVFRTSDPNWSKIFEGMRDVTGFEDGQKSLFRQFSFDPRKTVLTDDRSSLELISEKEFFGLITGSIN
jgi:predicted membrane-bound spermidine synthase